MKRQERFLRRAAAAIAITVILPVWAGRAAADGYVTFGTGGWYQSAPEAKYQEFRAVPRGVFLESFVVRDHLWNGKYDIYGTNAIRDDQTIGGSFRAPTWRVDLKYMETPHNTSFDSRTMYYLESPAYLTIPDSLQRSNQENPAAYTPTMTDFLNDANPVTLSLGTDVVSARLAGRPGQGLGFALTGSRRNRAGDKSFGGTFGFSNTIEIMEPIRQSMSEGQALLSYTKKRVTAQLIGNYSAFENTYDALVWYNPRRLTDKVSTAGAGDGPSKGRLALYPDNQTWRGTLQVGIQLPRATAFTGSAGIGQSTQNEDWLPYTINSAILQPDTFPLPAASLHGKADLTTIDARLTSRGVRSLAGTIRYRLQKYDNKTPVYTFAGEVIADENWVAGPDENNPVSNQQWVTGADVDWNPKKQVTLSGNWEYTDWERTYREIDHDKEVAYGAKIRVRPRSGLSADARYHHGDKDALDFNEEEYENASGALVEQPELRRYDVASRIQDIFQAGLGWTVNPKIQFSGTYDYLKNDYDQTELGLLEATQESYSLMATIHATDRLDLGGSFAWGKMVTQQRSQQSPGGSLIQADSLEWMAELTNEIVSSTANVEYQAIPDRFVLSADFWYNRSPGTYDLTGLTGSVLPPPKNLPATFYLNFGVGGEAKYTLQENLDVAARWNWQQFDADDWANQDIPLLSTTPAGASTAIYLGDNVLDYTANFVAVAVTRRF